MKKIFTLICISSFYLISQAQFNITPNTDATQLAQLLAGSGVTIDTAWLDCPAQAAGIFTDAPAGLGISDGIVLTTGRAVEIDNAPGFFASTNNSAPGDPDLNALLQSLGETYTTNDACVLEIDLTVTGSQISFNYVMGSEEYPVFVCDIFNDIFAFFITGPNPNGPDYNGSNIALVPGTVTPVSINTVNNGSGGFAPSCITTNTQYFNGQVNGIAYNGNTVVLEAFAETIPCETYHFKLAIADGGDNIYDSGVFLEEGSFQSNTVSINSLTAVGEGFNTAVEGCVNGLFTFELLDAQGDSTINILIGGTAENGVDYEFIPSIIDFTGGQTTVQIEIIAFEDGIEEGLETVIIYIESDCPGVFLDSAVLFIADRIPLEINPVTDSLCIGESVNVVAEGAQFYTWFPADNVSDPSSNDVIITPDTTSSYTLTYQLGTCIEDTVVDLSVINLDLFSSVLVNESCPGAADGSIEIVIENNIGEDVIYNWNNGADSSFVGNLEAGEYTLLVQEVGCEFEFFFEITVPPLVMEITADTIVCLGDQVNFQVFDNLVDNATYVWTPSLYIDSVEFAETFATPEENITYTLTGTNPAGCSISDSISIVVQNLSLLPLYTDTSIFTGETIEIGAEIDSVNLFDPIEFTWSPENFLESTTDLITNTTPESNIVYTLSAESGLCSDEVLITVLLNLTFQMPDAFTPNNDGINDVFYPENVTGGVVREFRIYNQWGEVIYDDASQGWDGTYNGVPQAPGQYFYFIRLDNGIENAILSGLLYLIL